MEASEPTKLRDKIVTATSKYLAQSGQWASVGIIRNDAEEFIDTLRKILGIKHKQPKTDREPQSEVEESKQRLSFEEEIAQEAHKFIQAIENL